LRHKPSLCKRSQPREDAVPFAVGSSDGPDELSASYLFHFSLKQGETYQFPHRLLGDLNCLYDLSICGDFFGLDGAKFTLQFRRYVAGRVAPEILDKTYHGLGSGQSVEVPNIPWDLRLDKTGNESANFSLVHRARVKGKK
jgi:hypothetical protein